jgi:hypothetical protein
MNTELQDKLHCDLSSLIDELNVVLDDLEYAEDNEELQDTIDNLELQQGSIETLIKHYNENK